MKDFYIDIPAELVAQYPVEKRENSRLLVYDIQGDSIIDDYFYNISRYITPGDCVVYNDARVINARLYGIKLNTGARLEILLTRRIDRVHWRCLIRPARRVKEGTIIELDGGYRLEVIKGTGNGSFLIEVDRPLEYEELINIGEIPLPRYIKRKPLRGLDNERYQTIYAVKYGAVAAPTAGLHFTEEIIASLKSRGTVFVPITLYVDWGTFKPVRDQDYRRHKIQAECYEITEESARIINKALQEGRRLVCVGTTTVRAIESVADDGMVKPGRGETSLYIYPGYRFKLVRAMLTNFHLPDSTLILLVAAFAGREGILKVYRHAVEERYRFFSYGDVMFLF
ncbi:MAG: tRNA preQ1(34) S-adenosylmethionine ribosyltransferase-isomerase QueA [Spirochaetota bacterium]